VIYLGKTSDLVMKSGIKPVGILYISYDGMLEPLGQSQVLAYLIRLASHRRFHLISFEKSADWSNVVDRQRIAKEIANAGIDWHPLRYHKSPSALATCWDIFCGISLGLWLVVRCPISVVHARSYVASLMALAIKRIAGVKYIFDMRGFWADERVDGKLWSKAGKLYSLAKFFERHFFLAADHVVVLTNATVRELKGFTYLKDCFPALTVIPTCADLKNFKRDTDRPVDSKFVLGYVGSAGTWYLFDEVAKCFALLLKIHPEAKLLVVNRNDHSYINERLILAGITNDSVDLVASNHANVPKLMARMSAGIFFYQPSYSRIACAPTKLAEFLGCGIPCLSNVGIGDMADLLETEQVGVAIKSYDDESKMVAIKQLIKLVNEPNISNRCVTAAQKHFSLDEGVRLYDEIYNRLC
jgi:glycosyltransferase involved in cell wall biosynthesis